MDDLLFLCINSVIGVLGLLLNVFTVVKIIREMRSRQGAEISEGDSNMKSEGRRRSIGGSQQEEGTTFRKKRYSPTDSVILFLAYSVFSAIIIANAVDEHEKWTAADKETPLWYLNKGISWLDKFIYLVVASVFIVLEYKRRPKALKGRAMLKLFVGFIIYISVALMLAKFLSHVPDFVSYFTNMIRVGVFTVLVVACRPRFKTFCHDVRADCYVWIFVLFWLPYNLSKIAKAVTRLNEKVEEEVRRIEDVMDAGVYSVGSLVTLATPILFWCFWCCERGDNSDSVDPAAVPLQDQSSETVVESPPAINGTDSAAVNVD